MVLGGSSSQIMLPWGRGMVQMVSFPVGFQSVEWFRKLAGLT